MLHARRGSDGAAPAPWSRLEAAVLAGTAWQAATCSGSHRRDLRVRDERRHLGPDQNDLAFLHVRTVGGELGEAGEAPGHEVGARWASPLPKETLARPISVIRTN